MIKIKSDTFVTVTDNAQYRSVFAESFLSDLFVELKSGEYIGYYYDENLDDDIPLKITIKDDNSVVGEIVDENIRDNIVEFGLDY